ncbi:MAG: cupin domain-containing protein [Denitrovibrio sp.]|nr:MAG: cupin domain-containing protein [Denitrovibrio sp.]
MNLKNIEEKEIIKGAKVKFIHSEGMTFAVWSFKKGAILPEHSHPHEQISKRISGQFELTVNGEAIVFEDDDVAVIPSNTVHSGRALTDCVMMDIFHPVRDDYR